MASNSFAYFGFLAAGTAVYHILPKRARKRAMALLHIRADAWPVKAVRVLFTFALTTVAWVFFRADSAAHALQILTRIFTAGGACFPLVLKDMGLAEPKLWVLGIGLAVFLLAEGLEEPLQLRDRLLKTVWLRYALWAALLIAVAVFGAYGTGYNAQKFVYFQF